MSRKDTIIVAVLVNAGLLIVLFASALHLDKSPTESPPLVQAPVPMIAPPPVVIPPSLPVVIGDEIDHALQKYAQATPSAPSNSFVDDLKAFSFSAEPVTPPPAVAAAPTQPEKSSDWTEIKVKKGDVLEKLARHHHTTVAEIMKINGLSTTNLRIGQTLKIAPARHSFNEPTPTPTKSTEETAKYYTVKKGDNPWTIAVKNHMKVDELLKLNHLSQEQARHLKPGDQLRIQ
jgi:LysM repeat protein